MPQSMPFDQAAALTDCYSTALIAARRANIKPGLVIITSLSQLLYFSLVAIACSNCPSTCKEQLQSQTCLQLPIFKRKLRFDYMDGLLFCAF